jgi:hypothetical protein
MGCGEVSGWMDNGWMIKKNELFSRDGLLPVIPFSLESRDIFGEGLEKAEIEPVG